MKKQANKENWKNQEFKKKNNDTSALNSRLQKQNKKIVIFCVYPPKLSCWALGPSRVYTEIYIARLGIRCKKKNQRI